MCMLHAAEKRLHRARLLILPRDILTAAVAVYNPYLPILLQEKAVSRAGKLTAVKLTE